MERLDKPIAEEKIVQDSPIESLSISPKSERLQNFKTLQASFIESYNTGEPVDIIYKNKVGYSGDTELNQATADKYKADEAAHQEVLEGMSYGEPEMFAEAIEAEVDLKLERQAMGLDPAHQFVDTIAGPSASSETKDAVANYVKLYELFEDATSDISGLDVGLDFVKSFMPFRDTLNEASLLGGVIGNEDRVRDLIFSFKSKSFEEQQQLFPSLSEEILSEIGEVRGMDLLRKFIEPSTENDLSDFNDWWKLVDAVDIASIGGAAVIKMNKFKKAFNLPKVLDQAENPEAAGEATARALVDPEAADAMNMTPESAVSNAIPFDTSIENIERTGGISSASLRSLRNFFAAADDTTTGIIKGNGYMQEGILNNVERGIAEAKAEKLLQNAQHENIRVTNRSENTTTFQFVALDNDGNAFDKELVLDLVLDDVGQWKQSELGIGSRYFTSPTVFAKGLTRLDADTAQRLDAQVGKLFRELTGLQKEAVKSLGNLALNPKNRRRLREVENVLRAGDEWVDDLTGVRGKVFDVEDLVGTYHLDEGQIEAYYKTNRLYNNLWRLRNNTKREEMIAFKYKRVELLDGGYSFGLPHQSAGDAYNSIRRANIGRVYDKTTDDVTTALTREEIDEQYQLGKIMVKLPEAHNAGAGVGKFSHVFVNADDVGELPAVVLNRKQGYVPKIAEDGHWFVKEYADDVIDGKETTSVVKTHRYFDNKADAVTYTEEKIVEDMQINGSTRKQAEAKFKYLEDREQEIVSTATGTFSNGSGGLYTAVRAEDDVLFGLDGDKGQRINPYEALVRNIANISRAVPINQWRLGLEQRWINSARELTGVEIEKFGTLPREIESTRAGVFLNKMAEQIRDWQGFPSKEEQVWRASTQRMYEWALGKDSKVGANIAGWLMSKDPVSATRAAAFHSLLGWFNPAQLWVQAQGMSVAVSLNIGKNLTETLRHTTGLTILGQGGEIGTKRVALAAKAAGMPAEDLLKIHSLWKKTGLEDSILQTADHAAAIRGHGIAMDAISRASDRGLFFYRHGEMLNRRMSFTSALDEWRLENSGAWPDTEDLKGILDRANNMMLNLTKANRAQFQKGVLGTTTQFFQVSAKALETIMRGNGNMTKQEAGRILAGQVALYGAAGVPLLGMGANYLLEVAQVTQEEIDDNPLLVKAFNDGFWGAVTLGIFGVDAEVSSRGSLVRGVTDFVDNWMFSESTAAVKLMGAFGSTNQRFWDSFTKSMRHLTFSAYPTDIIDVAKMPLMPFLDSISTWRNGEKAVFMQTIDAILDKKEGKVVERDFSIRESIAAAIGFRLSDETKVYTLTERTQDIFDSNNKTADLIISVMNEAIIRESAGILTPEYQQQIDQFYATVYGSLDYGRQKDIRNTVMSRLKSGSKESRAVSKYIDKVVGNTTDSLTAKSLLLGESVQTVGKPQEDQ